MILLNPDIEIFTAPELRPLPTSLLWTTGPPRASCAAKGCERLLPWLKPRSLRKSPKLGRNAQQGSPSNYPSICLCVSIQPSMYLSIFLSVLSIYMSVYLSVCLSIYRSTPNYRSTWLHYYMYAVLFSYITLHRITLHCVTWHCIASYTLHPSR